MDIVPESRGYKVEKEEFKEKLMTDLRAGRIIICYNN